MSLFVALVPALLYSAGVRARVGARARLPGHGRRRRARARSRSRSALADSTYAVEGVPTAPTRRSPRVRRSGRPPPELRAQLDGIHARYPSSGGAILVVSPQVPYRDVVQVMDEVREAGFGNSTLLGAPQ
jgi:hypothetical protein